MTRWIWKLVAVLVLTSGAGWMGFAADEKSSGIPATPTKVDWTGYATAATISGTIVKADEKGVLLRLSRIVPQGGASRNRPPRTKEVTEDISLTYADAGMVRWKKLPPKIKEDGTKGTYLPAEQAKLKLPYGVPGYAAERTALQPGHIVELVLVRPKDIPASKATTSDLLIKYAVIWGEAQTVPTEKK